jgi:hypothetical protein
VSVYLSSLQVWIRFNVMGHPFPDVAKELLFSGAIVKGTYCCK